MQDTSFFFDELVKQGLKIDENQKKQITEKINLVLSYEPRVGIFGKTGSGKSSLCYPQKTGLTEDTIFNFC